MADVEKYVDEIDQLTADQGCIGDEHDRWRSSVAAIIRRAQADAAEELARLRQLFDDAGQGEHNVLALVDYYQRNSMEADERVRAIVAELLQLADEIEAEGHATAQPDMHSWADGIREALSKTDQAPGHDAPARHGPGCPEHVAFWAAVERFARAGSNVAARMSAVADVEKQARVWGPLSARYYGATAEPRGCPTPGACSCPPAEPDR